MTKPVDFLTASGDAIWASFVLTAIDTDMFAYAEYVRDQTARAVEAKVRGECAKELETAKAVAHLEKVRADNAERLHGECALRLCTEVERADKATRRAETAEAERDAAVKRADYLHGENQANRDKLADAQREGAYEALGACAAKIASVTHVTSIDEARCFIEAFRVRYAPSPAPLMLGGWRVTWEGEYIARTNEISRKPIVSDEPHSLCHYLNHRPSPTEYAALCQLKENASNA